ncbi:MAG TPA: polyhydroxyalkanoate synthesis repressor PhaR [Methylibium sp.]|uniref:polyhydroxyalkanoate synthesis repressor PhaR n=1 Tax=Methylibium sp. TaxID=2067992 RepID=UPI002DC0154F|nr:polyhydroxyalkanoate synthesis repressor PhaR [Methylibium sp.]HEU4459707.1 polyhydroxyalkanoate synthesis repressor PhaR [Methylibium sp.]
MTQARARATRKTGAAGEADDSEASTKERVLKKYPNRRLYDTHSSGYITLADVRQMVLDNERFVVRDAKTGEDLTRSILLQIILEAEADGAPMFTTPVLANIIRFYGHTMQGLMGSYLEKNIQVFTDMQARFAEQSGLSAGQPFSPELWAQFMSGQAPIMQGLMSNYLDQSKQLFAQMQEQMHKQAGSLEALFPAGFGLGAKRP